MSLPPAWFPDAKWHLKTLGIIYICVTVFYYTVSFLLKQLPRPYDIRKIPIAVTPWLRKGPKYLEEDQLTPPQEASQAPATPLLPATPPPAHP